MKFYPSLLQIDSDGLKNLQNKLNTLTTFAKVQLKCIRHLRLQWLLGPISCTNRDVKKVYVPGLSTGLAQAHGAKLGPGTVLTCLGPRPDTFCTVLWAWDVSTSGSGSKHRHNSPTLKNQIFISIFPPAPTPHSTTHAFCQRVDVGWWFYFFYCSFFNFSRG